MHESVLDELQQLFAPAQVVTNPIELMTFENDASLDRGQPDGVVFPRNVDDVMRLVEWAAKRGIPLVARGAGTGLSGGAVPEHGGIVVQFSRMNRIAEIDIAGRSAIAEPGVVNLTLDTAVKATGLYYPPDPSSGRSATTGGNIAENSGGPHCFKYGVTTNYVSGLDVVLANGKRVRLGGLALDYPEYDLTGLVVGSEGTLAMVTQAYLRLIRNPPAVKTLMAAFETVEAAGEAVSAIIAVGLVPATLEMMDQKMMQIIEQFSAADLPIEYAAALIVEADGYAESVHAQIEEIERILQAQQARKLRIAKTNEERDAIWYGRKNAAGAMARLAPAFYLVDVTVPRSKLAPMLSGVNHVCESLGLRVGYVFHAGDGNLHPLILIENPRDPQLVARVLEAGKQIVELCVSFNGSITGEHGVGIEKRAYMSLMYTADELNLMREVKNIFDPQQIFNPGKIFPPAEPAAQNGAEARQAAASIDLQAGQTLVPESAKQAAAVLGAATQAGYQLQIVRSADQAASSPMLKISTEKLSGIISYARDDLYVEVGAGMSLKALQAQLAEERMWVPLISSNPESTLGDIISTNANAPLRMRYGGIRDLVLATTVALPDGRLIHVGRPVVKNVAGYDMPKLFIGAYGTLGLLTGLTLKLAPLPRLISSLIVPVPDLARGLEWGAKLLQICSVASALLLCDSSVLPDSKVSTAYALVYTAEGSEGDVQIELNLVGELVQAAGASGILSSEQSGSTLWADWLHTASTQALQSQGRVTMRLGVAPARLPQLSSTLLASKALKETSFIADLANGMLYLDGLLDSKSVSALAQAVEGYSIVLASSDPTIARWGYNPEALAHMQALKERWNPGALLNPGSFIV